MLDQATRNKLFNYVQLYMLKDAVCAAGLQFMYIKHTDSSRFRYHVDWYKHVRVTSMFFYHPTKALIVQLELTEQLTEAENHDFLLSMKVYAGFDRNLVIAHDIQRGTENDDYTFWRECTNAPHGFITCGHSSSATREGVHHISWHMEVNQNDTEDLPVEVLESATRELVTRFAPLLAKQFYELQVTSFAPEYVFPGCAPLFWMNFPWRLLKPKVITRIYGSSFR